jgi:ABC-type branched-subunit amino acid transport system ATPase component
MPERAGHGAGLAVRGLTVRFGGAVAVDGLDLDVPRGRITGLIGPNGAGKTTTFNACTGLIRPSEGMVILDGHDITAAAPQQRARLGLGRTFQRMKLFESSSVGTNVALGREALMAGGNPWRHLHQPRRDRRAIAAAAEEALALCGIAQLADVDVADLSTGQRRLVELARVVAGGFSLLLLDEPSSGLDLNETDEFGRVLGQLVAQRGVGILLVEHDMRLVMSVCAWLHVIDFGRPIFQGTPEETQASAAVQAAYLGALA